MTQIKIIIFFALFICALAWGGGRGGGPSYGGDQGYGGGQGFGGRQGYGGGGQQNFGGRQGYGGQNQMSGGYQGDNQGYGGNGRQQFGGDNGMRKYRSNLYNDDEVYGYDANYPNGEALYINYRSKDARSRRGQEFARISRAYSGRQGGGGGGGGNGYERSYGGNGMSQMGRNGNY